MRELYNCIHCNKKDDTVIDYQVENYDGEKLTVVELLIRQHFKGTILTKN